MALFGRKRKGQTPTGLPGKGVILSEGRADLWESKIEDRGEIDQVQLADMGIGHSKHNFELEVTLDDGRPPYTVAGGFNVPAKLGGDTGPGVTFPVYADPDDPTRIEIDWNQFLAGGGKAEFREGHRKKQRSAVHNRLPDANRKAMVDAWVSARKAGGMSPADFEKALADGVESGMLTPDDADAGRRAAE